MLILGVTDNFDNNEKAVTLVECKLTKHAMTSIVLIAPFPDCYFHLALLSHYAGSCNEYRSAPSDHSEDHRWSKFVTKTVCL